MSWVNDLRSERRWQPSAGPETAPRSSFQPARPDCVVSIARRRAVHGTGSPLDLADVALTVGELAARQALSKEVIEGRERAHRRRAAVRRGGHASCSSAANRAACRRFRRPCSSLSRRGSIASAPRARPHRRARCGRAGETVRRGAARRTARARDGLWSGDSVRHRRCHSPDRHGARRGEQGARAAVASEHAASRASQTAGDEARGRRRRLFPGLRESHLWPNSQSRAPAVSAGGDDPSSSISRFESYQAAWSSL